MKSYNISFEVVKEYDSYLVICDAMDYENWVKDPQKAIEGLIREWFDLDMGEEIP